MCEKAVSTAVGLLAVFLPNPCHCPCEVTASLPQPFPAELPLIDLMKLYEGAFLPNFQWPQPQPDGEETSEEEGLFQPLRGLQLNTGPVETGLLRRVQTSRSFSFSAMKGRVGSVFNMQFYSE